MKVYIKYYILFEFIAWYWEKRGATRPILHLNEWGFQYILMNNVVIYSYNKDVGRALCAMWCNYQEDTIHLLLGSVIVVGEIFFI